MKQICILALLLVFAMFGGCKVQQEAEPLSSEEVGEQSSVGLGSSSSSEEAAQELEREQSWGGLDAGSLLAEVPQDLEVDLPSAGLGYSSLSDVTVQELEDEQSWGGLDAGSLLVEVTQELEGDRYSAGLDAGSLSEEATQERTPDVIYVPTPNDVVDMMLHLARVTEDDVLYDLGCGDGRIVVAAAKKYGCKAFGYDIDPERVEESLENVEKNEVNGLVTIEQKDIFTLDLRPASVITLYLLPSLNVKLIPQLEKLEPGCRIVSHDFDMRGVRPDAVLTMDSEETGAEHNVYLWTTPLKKEEEEDYDDEVLLWEE